MNTFYLLRHGAVQIDPHRPARQWALSREGASQASDLAKESVFWNLDVIYSSEEEKSIQTAQIIASSTKKTVTQIPYFNELEREGLVDDYDSAVREAFDDITKSISGWESCLNARRRFKQGMELINMKHSNKEILIVSHGIVLTLYFANLQGEMESLFTRWKKLQWLSLGIVKDYTVIKDITD